MTISVFRQRARLPVTSFQAVVTDPPTVVIKGNGGFSAAAEVLINGAPATTYFLLSDSQIIAQIPPGTTVTSVDVYSDSALDSTLAVALTPGVGRRLSIARGVEYVTNKVLKALSTRAGSDSFNPTLGGGLQGLVASARPRQEMPALIATAISTTVESLRRLEPTDLPAAERIGTVRATSISFPYGDTISIELEITNALGETARTRVSQ
jgi:hypothetical protein